MKRQPARILMLLENNPYPQDSRVRKEATSLTEGGYHVTVVCPAKPGANQPFHEELNGVWVYRFPAPPSGHGIIGYLWEYGCSMVAMQVISWLVLLRHGFDVVHAHNPPDTLVLIGLQYKLLGKRFVFDHHDLSPELYAARFSDEQPGRMVKVLEYFERLSCRAADLIITTNQSYRELEKTRGRARQNTKIVIVRNGPSDRFFVEQTPDAELAGSAGTIIGYIGVIGFQDGVDYFLRALLHLVKDLGQSDVKAVIIGDGVALPSLKALSAKLYLDPYVWFAGWQDGDTLLKNLSAADICVAPEPLNTYNNRSTMIKLMEYMALGKPIVAFDLHEHRITADNAAVYAEPNNEWDFARHIAHLIDHPEVRTQLGQFGRERAVNELAWHHQAVQLLAGYASLQNSNK